mmetsp:Transcript_6499/g.16128  ORF Transcript_6499/g.16128 Transcript_6499/m.16128 type:complete len:80 (-) Transcript_6499:427-666(-)
MCDVTVGVQSAIIEREGETLKFGFASCKCISAFQCLGGLEVVTFRCLTSLHLPLTPRCKAEGSEECEEWKNGSSKITKL